MSASDDLRLFTIAELAELWGTGQDWIRRGVQGRKFAHTRIAREIKFTHEQARDMLASLAKPKGPGAPNRAEVVDIKSRRTV